MTLVTGFGLFSSGTTSGGGGVTSVSGGLTGLTFDTPTTTPTLQGVLLPAFGGTGSNTVFTAGSIPFAGGFGVYIQNNPAFTWDNTNEWLSIISSSDVGIISEGQIRAHTDTGFVSRLNAGGSGMKMAFRIESNAGGAYQYIGVSEGSAEVRYFAAFGGYYPTFYSNGSEVMRISDAGNVGIGTTSPSAKLHVNGAIMTADPGSGAGLIKLGRSNSSLVPLVTDPENFFEISDNNVVIKLAIAKEV